MAIRNVAQTTSPRLAFSLRNRSGGIVAHHSIESLSKHPKRMLVVCSRSCLAMSELNESVTLRGTQALVPLVRLVRLDCSHLNLLTRKGRFSQQIIELLIRIIKRK